MQTVETYVAARPMTLAGQPYAVGETVDVSVLSPDKLDQLVSQRFLRDPHQAAQQYVAARDVTLGGISYEAGEVVDVHDLRPDKIRRLVDQRWLDLRPDAA